MKYKSLYMYLEPRFAIYPPSSCISRRAVGPQCLVHKDSLRPLSSHEGAKCKISSNTYCPVEHGEFLAGRG